MSHKKITILAFSLLYLFAKEYELKATNTTTQSTFTIPLTKKYEEILDKINKSIPKDHLAFNTQNPDVKFSKHKVSTLIDEAFSLALKNNYLFNIPQKTSMRTLLMYCIVIDSRVIIELILGFLLDQQLYKILTQKDKYENTPIALADKHKDKYTRERLKTKKTEVEETLQLNYESSRETEEEDGQVAVVMNNDAAEEENNETPVVTKAASNQFPIISKYIALVYPINAICTEKISKWTVCLLAIMLFCSFTYWWLFSDIT